ncbi:hypothetical protein BDR26DRAFT_996483 [Obelidium mucronatum]|nr:hypothetical protein BDR26DRAFT_996483 [Obelidium mucronatum]
MTKNKQQAKTAKGAPKKSVKTVKTVSAKTCRKPFKYADIFSKSVSQEIWDNIPEEASCWWKALRGSASAHADMLQGRTSTGAAAEDKPEPPYFRELMNIMGKSVAAKGAYQQRDSINRGLRLRPAVECVEDDKYNEEQDDADTEDECNTTLSNDHLFGDQSFADGDLLDYNNAAKCSDSDVVELDKEDEVGEMAAAAATPKKLAAKVAKNKAITDKLVKMKEALKIKPPTTKPQPKEGGRPINRVATSMEKNANIQGKFFERMLAKSSRQQDRHDQMILDQDEKRKLAANAAELKQATMIAMLKAATRGKRCQKESSSDESKSEGELERRRIYKKEKKLKLG